ncbi:SDR family oxidoreductase [Actinokineospora auranticolor]|uniref:NAD(P)H dehydrogenase (Quinone) n=1 Tax=Actinokineospora auranticolor TaxID=155976 RepID=A0A2S6GYZ0_9PSEU|nr:SDR family oxidoreductase [Actinokineospora auranticolor]PPK70449.1 NAD(P)H dehydrogenase (quinone) [Actinokineospora auranticolor]
MTILVTGATGNLGGLIVKQLLTRVPAADLAVSVRAPEKAAHLAAQGVDVRQGDFGQPESLRFDGVDTLVLVSADGPDDVRVAAQKSAVDAADKAGVGRIVYTSVSFADVSPLGLARVHAATEDHIRASGLPFTFLRNGMYHENYVNGLPGALERGSLVTTTGAGRIASVSREDLAEAAAVVATTQGHDGAVYELTGPRAWGFDELAALAAEVTGKPLTHVSVEAAQLHGNLVAAGLPEFVAELLTDIQSNIRTGALSEVRPDLAKLIGRAPTPIETAVRAAL